MNLRLLLTVGARPNAHASGAPGSCTAPRLPTTHRAPRRRLQAFVRPRPGSRARPAPALAPACAPRDRDAEEQVGPAEAGGGGGALGARPCVWALLAGGSL